MRTMNAIGSRAGVLAGAALLLFGLASCDFVEPTSVNPNAVPDATIDQLFTGVQVNTIFYSEGQASRIAAIFTQQMTGTDRQFAGFQEYEIREGDADEVFNTMYTGGGLIDLRDAQAQAAEAGRRVYGGILKVYEAYLVGMTASLVGDIPYSEAVNPEIEDPVLDEQAAVYSSVQSLLDEAIADLQSGAGVGPGSTDLVHGGDAAAWVDVANTLKARFHLHWAEVEGDSRYSAALAAAANGIQTNASNFVGPHSSSATEANFWSQFETERSGYISSGITLLPLMRENDDPRIGFYFSGPPFVSPAEEGSVSTISPTGWGAAAWDFPLVTAWENSFIMAEAGFHVDSEATAKEHAVDALEFQESFYGVSLDGRKAAINAASGQDLLELIMQEKWTAQFLNIDVWNDWKRTCMPTEIESTVAGEDIPGRIFYSTAERQTNPNVPPPNEQPARNDNDPNPCF